MRRNIDSNTPKFIENVIHDSKGVFQGQELLDRARRGVAIGRALLKTVVDSDLYLHPEFIEELSTSHHEAWWVLRDYSADAGQISSFDIALGISPRFKSSIARSIADTLNLHNHHLTVKYSQAANQGGPPIEREISVVDRLPLDRRTQRHLGQRAIKHSLGISYDISRTQQELTNSLHTIIEPHIPDRFGSPLEDFYEKTAQRYDEVIPSEDDLLFIKETIIPRTEAILAINGIRQRNY